jgi:DNA adenine methylase
MKEWVEQKHINNNPSEFSILEIGFSTLYLNRTNRSGILKAGVIGGKNQNSEYKMDCRFNKDTIIKRIRDIESQKHKIQLYNHDIFLLLDLLENIRTPNSLIYFDPPYYKKGPELYLNFFNHEEHDLLSKRISKLDCNWLLTYDNTEEVIELYPDFTPSEFSLQYSLQNKMKGQEVLFLSNSLVHPKVKKIC